MHNKLGRQAAVDLLTEVLKQYLNSPTTARTEEQYPHFICPDYAYEALEKLGIEWPDEGIDQNGWQGDWWLPFTYDGRRYQIAGTMFYGTGKFFNISKWEEEEDGS